MNKKEIMRIVFEKLCKMDSIYIDSVNDKIVGLSEINEDSEFYAYIEPDIYFTKTGEIFIDNAVGEQLEHLELTGDKVVITPYQYHYFAL